MARGRRRSRGTPTALGERLERALRGLPGGARRAAGAVLAWVRTLPRLWRRLDLEQRLAAAAAVALAVSTIGPFSFVEAAVLLVSGAVALLLIRRAEGGRFHLPFGDGSVLAAAGAWSAVLILTRAFDRAAGQTLLALACAGLLVLVGVRQRRRRPPDDVPTERLFTESRPPQAPRGDDERGGPGPERAEG